MDFEGPKHQSQQLQMCVPYIFIFRQITLDIMHKSVKVLHGMRLFNALSYPPKILLFCVSSDAYMQRIIENAKAHEMAKHGTGLIFDKLNYHTTSPLGVI